MRDFAQVKGNGKITTEVANYALEALNIDKYGLLTARDQARHSDAATTNRYAKVKHTAHIELRDWDGDL